LAVWVDDLWLMLSGLWFLVWFVVCGFGLVPGFWFLISGWFLVSGFWFQGFKFWVQGAPIETHEHTVFRIVSEWRLIRVQGSGPEA